MTEYQAFLLDRIEEDTAAVRAIVRFFPPGRWDWAPGDLWTARQHVVHLRNTEERYRERLQGVLAHGEYAPAAGPQPPPRESAEDPVAAIEAYAAARAQEVDVLRGLRPDQWDHTFEHPTAWGRVSIEFWAERILAHTADHIQGLLWLRQLGAVDPAVADRAAALT